MRIQFKDKETKRKYDKAAFLDVARTRLGVKGISEFNKWGKYYDEVATVSTVDELVDVLDTLLQAKDTGYMSDYDIAFRLCDAAYELKVNLLEEATRNGRKGK